MRSLAHTVPSRLVRPFGVWFSFNFGNTATILTNTTEFATTLPNVTVPAQILPNARDTVTLSVRITKLEVIRSNRR